jgi:hypothetical protein
MYNEAVRGAIESPDQSSVALAGGLPPPVGFFFTSNSKMLGCRAIAALIIRAAAKL